MSAPLYSYHGSGRNRATFVALAVAWGVLAAVWVLLDPAPLIMAFLTLATLPALWDLVTARRAGIEVTQDALTWYAGGHSETLALREIDRAFFDTRLDFSVRVRLGLVAGPKCTLPAETVGKPPALMAALEEAGVKTLRRHFSLLG